MYVIEGHEYSVFVRKWERNEFEHQRLGQAFYNHFELHKLNDQDSLLNLYEQDGIQAKEIILKLFEFH